MLCASLIIKRAVSFEIVDQQPRFNQTSARAERLSELAALSTAELIGIYNLQRALR
jgi:hypothetical protein